MNMKTELKIHPIADAFPMLQEDDIQSMAEDIRTNGQATAIALYQGMILDGRNRYRACQIANVDPKTRDYTGKDPVAFVLSLNLHRRHLTTSQRAAVAANIANLKNGSNQHSKKEGVQKCTPSETEESLENSNKKAAKSLSVSPRSVASAKKVSAKSPEKFQEVINGKKTVGKALKEIEEEEKPKVKSAAVDDLGSVIPSDCLANWERKGEVEAVLSTIRSLKLKVTSLENSTDPLWSRVSWQEIQMQLKRVAYEIAVALPHAVCPYCQGRRQIKCEACKGFGILSKFHYQTVPSELRKDK